MLSIYTGTICDAWWSRTSIIFRRRSAFLRPCAIPASFIHCTSCKWNRQIKHLFILISYIPQYTRTKAYNKNPQCQVSHYATPYKYKINIRDHRPATTLRTWFCNAILVFCACLFDILAVFHLKTIKYPIFTALLQ